MPATTCLLDTSFHLQDFCCQSRIFSSPSVPSFSPYIHRLTSFIHFHYPNNVSVIGFVHISQKAAVGRPENRSPRSFTHYHKLFALSPLREILISLSSSRTVLFRLCAEPVDMLATVKLTGWCLFHFCSP